MSLLSAPAAAPRLAAAIRDVTRASAERFERALTEPERTQRLRLAAVLREVAGSAQAHWIAGFEQIRTAREFQDAVPLSSAETLASDVDRIARGEQRVLARGRVLRFECSGGSSGASKLIPYTAGLLREFHHAVEPWLHDIARARPRAWAGPGYWAISPVARPAEATPGGVAIGGAQDESYFSASLRRVLAPAMAVPGAVARLADVECCRYVTLRLLLERPDLAFMSAWNPSFLTLMMQSFDANAERLLDDLATGRCRPPGHEADPIVARLAFGTHAERARRLRSSARGAAAMWPELALISVWTDAQAARCVPALEDRFPGVDIQGKGLLATEGVVSIPWFDAPAPVLAVRSHFFEFIDIARPDARPRLAHELETGAAYEVVLSTASGLLRYRLGDRVRVEGRCAKTPCIRFLGREGVSDLVGEKLAASLVAAILARVIGRPARFCMLAPEPGSPPAYHLYVESDADDATLEVWASRVEAELLESFPYRYARDLGQLGPVRAVRVHDAERRYEAACVARGQRSGVVKPPALETRPGWREAMTGGEAG